MGQYGRHLVLGSNIRNFTYKYNMNSDMVNKAWTQLQYDQYDLGRMGAQIRELWYIMDKSDSTILDAKESSMMIDTLCTEWVHQNTVCDTA